VKPRAMYAYVGGRTPRNQPPRKQAINVYRVDTRTGKWTHVQTVPDLVNPSFFTFDRRRRVLYAVHGYFGEVSAFAIDPKTGKLTFLNQQPVQGKNPVALVTDPGDRYLLIANYGTGALATLPIEADGSLGLVRHLASLPGEPGPHRTQQPHSRPHHIIFDPSDRFIIVPDKGLDKTHVYRLADGKLVPNDPPAAQARPVSAPRHVDFHPAKPVAYVINELDSTITTFRFDKRGALTPLQTLTTLPPSYTGNNTTAEIVAAASGKFVYGSNRGHDSIAIFSVNQKDGTLKPLAWESTRGKGPRFFGIEPTGNFLYAANEGSGTIVTFRINKATGRLKATGQVIRTDTPVCIVFATPGA
jgi:6-phosphogluconolactonase